MTPLLWELFVVLLCFFLRLGEAQSDGSLRLVSSGSYEWKGRLEIYHDYRWGTICDDSFGDTDGAVACRQLGFTNVVRYGNDYPGSGNIWIANLRCDGTESRLDQCGHSGWGAGDTLCGHHEDVYLVCTSTRASTTATTEESSNEVSSWFSCDFSSSSWCDLTQSYNDDFDWTLQSGSTPSSSTGPSIDHTTGTSYGYYVYIETTSGSNGYTAKFKSPAFTGTPGQRCTVTFWYHMYGSHINTLNVYASSAYSADWTMSGDQGDIWQLATFSFSALRGSVVTFEGIRGTDYQGDIALDDIDAVCEFAEPDITPPKVTGCPNEIRAQAELDTSFVNVNWTEPTATDNSTITTIYSHASSSSFPIGTTGVAYIFTDSQGNVAICSFDVIVDTVDTTSPTISNCPSDITIETDFTTNGTTVFWNEPNATDPSGIQHSTRSHEPSTFFTIGVTLVTYEFVDAANNSAYCTFSVTVEIVDIGAPVVTQCPSDFDYVGGRHVTWTEPTAYDLSGYVIFTRSHLPGVFLTSTTEVVYTFTDYSNNIAYCNFTVNIIYDMTPPVITGCPSVVNASVETGHSETSVFWTSPSATDDFGRVFLIHITHVPGENFPVGSTPVVYTFADDSYNMAHCNFSVFVDYVDMTPPTIDSCPTDIVEHIEFGTSSTPVYWSTPSATDMSGNVSLVSQTHFPGDRFTTGRTNVIYKFADSNGNEKSCVFSVSVTEVDTKAPTITNCPPDIMGSSISKSALWVEPSASDASGNVTMLVRTHSPGDPFAVGSTNVMYMFADSSNNIAVCSFNIYINSENNPGNNPAFDVDITAPLIIDCPDDIQNLAEIGLSQVTISWKIPSAFDQNGSPRLIFESHKPGDVFFVGSTSTISYIFADNANNRATCNFTVTIKQVDTTPPSIDYCPDDIIETTEIGVTTASVSWTEPRASDLSGNVTLSLQSRIPKVFSPLRDTVVIYVFEDKSGNEATCQFFVSFNIVDSTPPSVISCPSDIYSSTEIGTSGTAVSWSNPSVMDLSGSVNTSSSHIPGHIFPVGSTVVSYQFEDVSLNRAECNFAVHVTSVDTTPPRTVSCPDNIGETIELGDMVTSVSWSEPIASDNSGNVSLVSQSHISGDNFSMGKTQVKYVFADGAGNEASCIFYVTLISVDKIPPKVVNCPSDIITVVEIGSVTTSVTWTEPSAVDVSGNVTLLTKTQSSGGFFGIGSTPVVYLFSDSSNNIAVCSFIIRTETEDSTPPDIVSCPSNIYLSAEIGTPGIAVDWNSPIATDRSGNVKASSSHEPGDIFPIGLTEVVYRFEDDFSNHAECKFTVNVASKDTRAPTILNCPTDVIKEVEVGSVITSVSWQEPSAVDASGNATLLVKTHSSGEALGVGPTTVMYLFSDSSNNIAGCTFVVKTNFVDTMPPNVLNCPSDIRTSAEIGVSQTRVFWNEPSATDESGRISLHQATHNSGQLFPVGTTDVSYTFMDESNNIAFCTFSVIIDQVDTNPPEITGCPSDLHETVNIGTNQIAVSWTEPSANDKSGHVTLLHHSHASGDLFAVGSTLVSYTFVDGFNNSATCDFTVTVTQIDIKAPTLLCCPDDIQMDVSFGSFGSIVNWVEPNAEDDSGNVILLVQTHVPGTFFAVGTTIVTYIFKDSANNMKKCSFSITIAAVETSSPVIFNCPSNILASVKPGQNETTVMWIEPFAINLSAGTKIASTHRPNDSFKLGSTQVAYTFKDDSGNQEFCNFTVVVVETDALTQESAVKGSPGKATRTGSGSFEVSIIALLLSLSIIVFGCLMLAAIYIRRKKNSNKAVELQCLKMSGTDTL